MSDFEKSAIARITGLEYSIEEMREDAKENPQLSYSEWVIGLVGEVERGRARIAELEAFVRLVMNHGRGRGYSTGSEWTAIVNEAKALEKK